MFGIDFLIVILYFVLVIGIGFYYSKEKDNTSQYFLANRNLGWFVIGASLFASNIGSEHLVGLAEGGYIRGVIESQFEILAEMPEKLTINLFGLKCKYSWIEKPTHVSHTRRRAGYYESSP